SAIVLADLNGDGKTDIALPDSFGNRLAVLLNTGGLTFSVVMASLPPFPTGIAVGDMNGDCRPDLVVSNRGGVSNSGDVMPGGMTVLLNHGGTAFTAGPLLGATTDPFGVALADVNGDGQLDIVGPDSEGRVAVLLRYDIDTAPA